MLWLLQKAAERLKTLLVADAALDLEAQFLARQTERKAELLRKAHEYEEQGLHELAEDLRGQAATLSIERPLASVLPALDHLTGDSSETALPRLEISPDKHHRLTANGTAGKASKPKVRTTPKRTKAR